MNSWVNYHSHSKYCDGTASPEEYIKEVIRLRLPAYGFSSHAPVPFSSNWNMPDTMLSDYLIEIGKIKQRYGSQLQVYQGMEIDFIPDIAGRFKHLMNGTKLDYFIGSIHYIGKFSHDEYWNIDTSHELFQKGLKELFGNDFRKVAVRFWEITRQMIEEDQPTIIGHLDKIKMFNKKAHYFDERESWYTEQVELTLDAIKKYGCIVEINTRGYYRQGQPEMYPSDWIIRRLAAKNIPIIISSDAHTPEEILSGMSYAAKLLKAQGVKKLAALYDNTWNEYPYSEDGLQFN